MILRRVIQHVTSQNWFAVIVDFLIVVVGIFVGLQVQGWSLEQTDRIKERQYLERILADVDYLIKTNTDSFEYTSKQRKAVWLTFQSLNNCTLDEHERDQFANGLYYIGRVIPPNHVIGTVREMRSAGDFGLIRNSKIRDLLNQLLATLEFDQALLSSISERVSNSTAYLDQRIVINRESLGPFEQIAWSELKIDFKALCNDPKVLGALTITRSIRQIYLSRIDNSIKLFKEAKQALQQELDRRDTL
jgi:hypothetical protein